MCVCVCVRACVRRRYTGSNNFVIFMRCVCGVCLCGGYSNRISTNSSSPAQINLGRIAALLGYCYNLCKTFISQNVAAGSLVSFIAMVATWLFKFLIKAKFYDWLEKQGGWVGTVHSRN